MVLKYYLSIMDPKDGSAVVKVEAGSIPTDLKISEISEERLLDLYSRIKPIVEEDDGNKYTLREFTPDELRNISYYWKHGEDCRYIVDENDLETIQDFYCLHTWGYYGLFKPSIAEVLSQMPEDVAEQANFFEIIELPKTDEDLNNHKDIVNASFHLSKVRTYRLKTQK